MKRMLKDPDMVEEYDFSKGIRGKYAKRYAEGTNVVVIEPDVEKRLKAYKAGKLKTVSFKDMFIKNKITLQ